MSAQGRHRLAGLFVGAALRVILQGIGIGIGFAIGLALMVAALGPAP